MNCQDLHLNAVTMEWLMDDGVDARAEVSLARMTIAVGGMSELHSHSNCTETVHVIEGEIQQRCGVEWVVLSEGQTLLIPKNTPHQTRNTGDNTAVLMLVYSSGKRIYNVESL